ncbi:MAG: hypothetical protein RI911_351 [Candidatus Parcubacteria bacterium]|jgi:uncharacterized repeat protein (TIGR01451 family)
MEQNQQQESNPALTVFAILGFIALLIAGLWSTIQLVKQGSQMISGTGTRGVSSLVGLSNAGVSMKLGTSQVNSEDPFTLSWSVARADGTLTLTYACREHVYIQVNADGSSYAIPCNAPYSIPSGSQSLSLTAVSDAADDVEIPLTLNVTTSSGQTSKDAATITVRRAAVTQKKAASVQPEPVVTPAPETKQPAPKPQPIEKKAVMVPVKKSDDSGKADLKPTITQIGVLVDGSLVEKNVFTPGDVVVVKFDVTNTGTKVARGWAFTATLPSNPVFTYRSEQQEDLYAGATAHLTMTFDKIAPGTGIVSIQVDAAKAIPEVSDANNGTSRQIVVQ